jgi:hypothetical protein
VSKLRSPAGSSARTKVLLDLRTVSFQGLGRVLRGSRCITIASTLVAFSVESVARADVLAASPGAVDNGFSIGFRTGYALPAGNMGVGTNSDPLSTAASGEVPLWFDVGYLINPYFSVGLYFAYGFVQFPSKTNYACDPGTCSASNFRAGADVQFRWFGKAKLQPWVGLGAFGFESINWNLSGVPPRSTGWEVNETVTGIEWINPQIGLDYKLPSGLSAGLFTGISVSQYEGEVTNSQECASPPGAVNGIHEWIYIGARVSFDFGIHLPKATGSVGSL